MIMKTNFPILRQILFAAIPPVLLAGCSDKDDPAPIGVAGVEVSQPTLELALDGTGDARQCRGQGPDMVEQRRGRRYG